MDRNLRQIHTRIIADIFLFFAVLFAPWWLVALFAGACVVSFKKFYEAFFAGFLFDALYGVPVASAYGFRFFFSSAALFVIFLSDLVREKVRR
ncbi:MAG: hypothetical protein HYT94_04325 [Parcubacteria group bacterium]|nr:hypothetical protein [Parcubacteria group bacterium]